MNKAQQKRYESLYRRHISALERQGKSQKTIDAYVRALRRMTEHFDCCPDLLTREHFEDYFSSLVKSHSWTTIKVDRNGLQFFYKYILKRDWEWVDIIKPPVIKSLPDILTQNEISHIVNSTRAARYQTYLLTTYSMGLRLGEVLNLSVGDIDSQHMRVHIRQGKGRKDRFVTLPTATLYALRRYWCTHRHKTLLFPAGKTPAERHRANVPMDRGGLQKSFKAITQSCGIHKQVTIHTLRRCYATHLVETGLNLRAIQQEMGHACPKTTVKYTQLPDTVQQNARELIDHMVNQLTITLEGEV